MRRISIFLVLLLFIVPVHAQAPQTWLTWAGLGSIYIWDGELLIQISNHPENTNAAFPRWSRDGWLSWEADADGDKDIYISDRQTIRNLSQNEIDDTDAAWSPTGQLAWVEHRADNAYMRVWDREAGLILETVTGSNAVWIPDFTPRWSARGHLAWGMIMSYSNPDRSLFGGGIIVWNGEAIINVSGDEQSGFNPRWSPDGQFLSFSGSGSENGTSALIVWDGTNTIELSPYSWDSFSPVWSVDNQLAFMPNIRLFDSGAHDIWVWNGAEIVTATGDMGAFDTAAWSPANYLAFASEGEDGNNDIFIWDGANIINITNDEFPDSAPFWLDANRLVYRSYQNQQADLFLWDGSSITRLTDSPETEWNLQLSPDGRLAWLVGNGGYGDSMNASAIQIWDGELITLVLDNPQAGQYLVTGFSWSPMLP
jgi:hypothetical protein